MRIFIFSLAVISITHAQEVAKPSSAVALATSGQFVISTRNVAPSGQKAQPEVYEVITGKDGSAALTLGALGSVKLEADTQIRMPAATSPQSLELLKGKLFLNIDGAELKKNQNTEFRLKTPTALLAVKGTQFFLDTSATQETIGVHEGAVAVAALDIRSTALLQKGQAATHGASQPLRARAMSAEEQALTSQYGALLLIKTPAAILVVSGTSGMAEYLRDGRPASIAQDDVAEISKLGACVMIVPEASANVRLELAEAGHARVISTQPRGAATPLRLKLILRQPSPSSAAALRFYVRSSPDEAVAVEGKLVTATQAAPLQVKNQPVHWRDCLLALPRTIAEASFSVEVTHTPSKGSSKHSPVVLEFSDFTLLSAPAGP